MLPPNWGAPHPGPRRFDLASEGLAVRERYRPLGESRQLDRVFEVALNGGAESVYLDRPYVDFDYRSDLSHFYGRAHRPPPPEVERLIFATDTEVIGASVVRPLPQQVGRTLQAPPLQQRPYVTCIAEMPVHAFGFQWAASGYPFTSQDGEYGVCAHAAIWSIARYHHLRFGTDRHTTSGIIEAAGLRERPDKTARSEGLWAQDVVRALRGIGLPALQYDVERIPGRENAHTIIHRYLNSGIPVGIFTRQHMMVLIGYGVDEADEPFYIVSDDNHSAYERMRLVTEEDEMTVKEKDPNAEIDAWKMLVIPQPGRIHVNGEGAEARAEETFEDRVRASTGPAKLLEPWLNKKLLTRTYAAPSAEYVSKMAGRGVPDSIRAHHIYAPKGNWLWVTEFQDPTRPDSQLVVGEIAIDATSLQLDPSPIFGNIDGWAYVWEQETDEPSVIELEPSAHYESALADPSEVPPGPEPSFGPYNGSPVD
jgi:hypothetical protein